MKTNSKMRNNGKSTMGNSEKNKKMNPFEIHINKMKLEVLGQKNKNDRGMPGVARAKANKIRERTLLDEYKKRNKTNVFKDRRIGENNPSMDPEKKIALRMAKEMQRQLSKKNLYNLNDDDDGLAEDTLNIKDDFNFSDDDDDPEDQQLDYKYVKAQHFGGGGLLTKSTEGDGNGPEGERKFKSKKERIEEIIAESKMAKANKKRDKEQIEDAVAQLDSQLGLFLSLMSDQKMTDDDKEKAKQQNEFKDYDRLTRELTFDRSKKAKAADRLKTPEEIAKEENERLRNLESARVSRMMGEEPNTTAKASTWSADDLNDGFAIDNDDRPMISYHNGVMNKDEGSEEGEESGDDEDMQDDEQSGDEEGESGNEELEEGGEEQEDAESDEEEDNYSDLEESESEVEEEKVEEEKKKESVELTKKKKKNVSEHKKKEMEEAAKELPYTFEVPQEYEGFLVLFEDRSPKEASTILNRMISCNHPTLGNNNTAKCQEIFKYILQTMHLICDSEGETFKDNFHSFEYLDSFIQPLWSLAQLSSTTASESFLNVLDEKYAEFTEKKKKCYPLADCFIFLKVSGMIFPPSDYQHVVMTPVLSFLTQLLGQCRLTTRREFTAAMFTANLLYEYIYESKRYVPELLNLIRNIIFLSIPGKDKTNLPHTGAPIKIVGPQSNLLNLKQSIQQYTRTKLTLYNLNKELEMNDMFKITILNEALTLATKLCQLWKDLPSFHAVISPLNILLDNLPLENYPKDTSDAVDGLKKSIEKVPTTLNYLVKKAAKPKSLKMIEPVFEKIVDGAKFRKGSKEFQEKQKLTYKFKQERKNAQKALRKDVAYLAQHKHKEIVERDAVRKRKVNKLLSELAFQESDHNKMKRKKF